MEPFKCMCSSPGPPDPVSDLSSSVNQEEGVVTFSWTPPTPGPFVISYSLYYGYVAMQTTQLETSYLLLPLHSLAGSNVKKQTDIAAPTAIVSISQQGNYEAYLLTVGKYSSAILKSSQSNNILFTIPCKCTYHSIDTPSTTPLTHHTPYPPHPLPTTPLTHHTPYPPHPLPTTPLTHHTPYPPHPLPTTPLTHHTPYPPHPLPTTPLTHHTPYPPHPYPPHPLPTTPLTHHTPYPPHPLPTTPLTHHTPYPPHPLPTTPSHTTLSLLTHHPFTCHSTYSTT